MIDPKAEHLAGLVALVERNEELRAAAITPLVDDYDVARRADAAVVDLIAALLAAAEALREFYAFLDSLPPTPRAN